MSMRSNVRFLLWAFVISAGMLMMSTASFGQISLAISFAPPALPLYEQPPCPDEGYLWTPGYWAWDPDYEDYYWVPGTWVLAPEPGYLWTPPYWAWGDGGFVFYDGYWGPQVGFYGGIDYGFGYFGTGFEGGRWDHGHFFYNRAVMNVNVTNIHDVYDQRVEHTVVNHVSYNGGNGGITARPTPQQEAAAHERHLPPVAAQTQHIQAARGNAKLRASANHGKPPIAATARPADFRGKGVIQAKQAGAPYHPPAKRQTPNEGNKAARAETNTRVENKPAQNKNNAAREESNGNRRVENTPENAKPAVHPNELPPVERPAAPNTGNAKQDKKYQQQQEKLMAQQNKERQQLQQRQEKEHQQLAKQQANAARTQQVEQKHQQQTQQLQQRHTQQMQHLQQRQQPVRTEPKPPKKP